MAIFELSSSLGALLTTFAIQVIFYTCLIWCAMKLLKKKGTTSAIIASSAVAALFGTIPFIGPLFSLLILILLMNRFTKIGKFNSLLVVITAWVLGISATIGLFALFDTVSVDL